MIRAVPVPYFINETSGKESHLAFLSTVTDKFIEIDGCQVWDSWSELSEVADIEFLNRVRTLCPKWFLDMHGAR